MMNYAKVKSIVAAQVAVFAFGCAAATVAHAEEAPLWSVEGARLAAGQTREITAKTLKPKPIPASRSRWVPRKSRARRSN
jgi:hypothetical protein